MARRVLVVTTTTPSSEDALRERIRREAGDDAEIRVVAPASKISFLDWLTNAEDDARQEAEQRAERVANELPAQSVDAGVGDTDPLLAVEDALRTGPADEVIVVTPRADAETWLEKDLPRALSERIGLPVKHLVDDG
jgi:hypothetical protein